MYVWRNCHVIGCFKARQFYPGIPHPLFQDTKYDVSLLIQVSLSKGPEIDTI